MEYVLIALAGYLLGTSSMAFYLSKLTKKDVRKSGSGNLGASNTMALLGWRAAVLVGIHDIGKSLLAVLLAKWIFPEVAYAGAVAGVACVIGHIYPFYLKFKGGKGLASYIGMMAGLDIWLAVAMVVLLFAILLITDYIALSAVTMVVIVPGVVVFTQGWFLALILLLATAVMIYKHIENLVRIFRGQEMGFRNAAKGKHRM